MASYRKMTPFAPVVVTWTSVPTMAAGRLWAVARAMRSAVVMVCAPSECLLASSAFFIGHPTNQRKRIPKEKQKKAEGSSPCLPAEPLPPLLDSLERDAIGATDARVRGVARAQGDRARVSALKLDREHIGRGGRSPSRLCLALYGRGLHLGSLSSPLVNGGSAHALSRCNDVCGTVERVALGTHDGDGPALARGARSLVPVVQGAQAPGWGLTCAFGRVAHGVSVPGTKPRAGRWVSCCRSSCGQLCLRPSRSCRSGLALRGRRRTRRHARRDRRSRETSHRRR
uniref:Uncharacterized protein n=1 Tax=uncultured marine virus TaxID=186617 RepID=A0A0F7LAJ0_9VIRU|nr:hypothetical protein [uncultured marine virus]